LNTGHNFKFIDGLRAISFLLLVLFSYSGIGQSFEYVYDKFTTDQGLPDDYIKDLDIDSKGNIWILTRKGIVKFDGLTFESIPIQSKLPFKEFEIDQHDNLWLNIFFSEESDLLKERIIIYDTKLEKSLKLQEYCITSIFDNSYENKLWTDKASNILLSNLDNEVFFYEGDSLKKILDLPAKYQVDTKNKEPYKLSYRNERRNEIYTYDFRIDSIFSIKQPRINSYIWDNNKAIFKSHFVYDSGNTNSERGRVNINLTSDSNDTLINSAILYLKYIFLNDEFYYITLNSFNVYDRVTGTMFNISDKFPSAFSNIELLNINTYGDAIWIGTNDGLIKIKKRKNIFQAILNKNINSIREMSLVSKDTLLICSENGGIIYDLKENRVLKIFDEYLVYYSVTKLDTNQYLLGTFGQYNILKNISDGSSFRINFNLIENDSLNYIPDVHLNSFKDYMSRLWLTSLRGICLYHDDENNKELEYLFKDKIEGIAFTDIIQGRSKKHLFLLSDNGLYEVDVDSMRLTGFDMFKNKVISHITPDKNDDDVFWVACRYEGLIKWKYGTNEIEIISEMDGLSNNNVHSVFQDNHDRLWLSTDFGISIYSKATHEISIITEDNGIHENEMNRHSYCFVNDSLILYGTINGIIKFNPYEVLLEDNSQEIVIKSLSYFDPLLNAYNSLQIDNDVQALNLRRNQSETKLIFDIPQNSYSNTLRYIFSSGNNEWLYTQGNSIDLTNLEEGYTSLFINKKVGINEWSSPKTIQIYKAPPFYKNYWFYGLIVSLGALGILIYINNRRVSALKLNRRIQREVDTKTKELFYKNKSLTESKNLNEQLFTIIGHDLRSPLISLNNIAKSINYLTENEDYNQVKKLTKSVETNSKKSLAIIDRLIDWTEAQKNSMLEFHEVNISDCVGKAIYEHDYFANKRGIQITSVGHDWINCISNEASLLIVLGNVIANAIKFSDDNGKIEVKFDREVSHIVIEIMDEGIGMDEDQLQKLNNSQPIDPKQSPKGEIGLGMGILMSFKVVKKINGKLAYKSKLGKGTTAVIRLPH